MSLEDSLVLGRYRVILPLDSRKLIRSYIARDEHRDGLGNPVLIKHHLHDLGDRDSAPMAALLVELGRLTHLRHPGVVSLLDYGTPEQGGLLSAHDHQLGLSLSQLCDVFEKKHEAFPPHLAIYIARSLLDTLQHCHTRSDGGFKHGRLTLGCVQLTASGLPMVADFGLAALEEAAAEAEMQLGFFQTRMSYSAPELTRGGAATVRGDTYSIALLFYRLLAGSNPFRGRSIPETLQRVQQLAPAELMLPEWKSCRDANRVLKRALDKDPSVRFADCLELSAALAKLSSESDERCREELAALVRRHGNGDWSQLSRLGRSVRRSLPPASSRDAEHLLAAVPHESKAPAFVSGLVTEQPRSVSEHTTRDERERLRRQRRRQMVLPTVLIPAVAIIFGLFLGRIGGTRATASRAAAERETPPLVNALVEDLRSRLQRCGPERGSAPTSYGVELEFAGTGELSGVRLEPRELSHSRLGACLLETVWEAGLRAPGAMSVRIPLGQPR